MKALLKSYNLIGDGLAATPAIETFRLAYPEMESVTVASFLRPSSLIYHRVSPEIQVVECERDALDEDSYDFVFDFDISRAYDLAIPAAIPATMAFAVMAGVKINGLLPIYHIPEGVGYGERIPRVLLQPYTRSCASHQGLPANKRWQDEKWVALYKHLKEEFSIEVLVLGTAEDPDIAGIPPQSHWKDLNLDQVAAMQRDATLIVTLDNGISHLAASQGAHMLSLYPEVVPPTWMGDLANEAGRIIHCRPWDVGEDFVWDIVREEVKDALHKQRWNRDREVLEVQ